MLNNIRGFTLLELLIVVAIIGILVTVVVVAVDPARLVNQARDSRHRSNLNQIRAAMQLYYNDCKEYPTDAQFDTALANGSTWLNLNSTSTCDDGVTYMRQIPSDPGYVYSQTNSGQGYRITADLSTTQTTRTADDTKSLQKCNASTTDNTIDFAVCND